MRAPSRRSRHRPTRVLLAFLELLPAPSLTLCIHSPIFNYINLRLETIMLSDYHYQGERHTADTSALKRSVPREQGSCIRHSRPESSAAPASRLQTAMAEVVGPERGEGNSGCTVWPTECSPSTRCSSRRATLPACRCHTARTVAFWPSVSWGELAGVLEGAYSVMSQSESHVLRVDGSTLEWSR